MTENLSLEAMAAQLLTRDGFLILTHRRPDGDTIGSAAALCRLLRQAGKRAFVAVNEDATSRYSAFLSGLLATENPEYETLVAVDIADESLFCASMAGYKGKVDFCIDHHPSNKHYAARTHVEAAASAVGEIIYQLAGHLGLTPDVDTLSAIYLAILTDTGCFLYANTTTLAHQIAARCVEAGVPFHALNTEFVRKKTKARFQIERALMDNLIFSADGAVAAACLTRAEIDAAGADEDDLDNLAALVIALEGIECAALLTEYKSVSGCKVSLRTKAPLDGSAICQAFGGGGHARAAGCSMQQDVYTARQLMMDEIDRARVKALLTDV